MRSASIRAVSGSIRRALSSSSSLSQRTSGAIWIPRLSIRRRNQGHQHEQALRLGRGARIVAEVADDEQWNGVVAERVSGIASSGFGRLPPPAYWSLSASGQRPRFLRLAWSSMPKRSSRPIARAGNLFPTAELRRRRSSRAWLASLRALRFRLDYRRSKSASMRARRCTGGDGALGRGAKRAREHARSR